MKGIGKYVTMVCLLSFLSLATSGCGNTKTINGVEYDTYGLLNEDEGKNPNIRYSVIWGNVVWGVLLSVFFLIPAVYFFGFSLFEPVAPKGLHQVGEVVK